MRKTVLVLGAGASRPYGFPLGSELLAQLRSWNTPQVVPSSLMQAVAPSGVERAAIVEFSGALHRSGISSVDTFLARRPDLVEVGKLLITFEIASKEADGNLHRLGNDDDWYRHLWNRLVSDADNIRDVTTSALRIVTFNYDRSLEAFMFDAAQNTFNLNQQDAQAFVDELQIRHVYGEIGKFHFDPAVGSPYEWRPSELAERAAGIRIIPEARMNDGPFPEVRTWFEWAQDICFVGFGFDRLNCERLNLPSVQHALAHTVDLTQSRGQPAIYATVVGMTSVERGTAQSLVSPKNGWNMSDSRNLQFFRETPIL